MILTRNSKPVNPFWGSNTQPERMEGIIEYATSGGYILDLGSGRGAYTKALSIMGFKVVGFDVNYYPEWKTTGEGNFVIGTGTKLPFCRQAFDTTIAFEVLEHIPDPVKALKEIARCTKDRLIFSVPNCDTHNALRRYDLAMAHWTDPTHCNFFTKSNLEAFLIDNGFKIIDMSDCYRISPNNYYWDTLKIPRKVSRVLKSIIEKLNLAETYWSSVLVVSEVPKK